MSVLNETKRCMVVENNSENIISSKMARKQSNIDKWNSMSLDEKIEQKELKTLKNLQCEERLIDALSSGLNVCIDLSFDSKHSDKEKKSMYKQISLTYGILKRVDIPVHLHLTSLKPSSDTENGLRLQGMSSWHVTCTERAPWEVFPNDKIIILSPDAEEVLEDFSHDMIYVIGGIVDKSVKKSLTYHLALDQSIRCCRLPVQEYIPNRQSHILNIDTVVSIICNYLYTRDWLSSLTSAIPLRRQTKGGKEARKALITNV